MYIFYRALVGYSSCCDTVESYVALNFIIVQNLISIFIEKSQLKKKKNWPLESLNSCSSYIILKQNS